MSCLKNKFFYTGKIPYICINKHKNMTQNLVNVIKEANLAYREGNPIMSDAEYDALINELSIIDPNNPVLTEVGFSTKDDSRKVALPITMASMNKVKDINELMDWCRHKNIPTNTQVVITPKYDGISLCVDESESKAFTRGDGKIGQRSDQHYKLIDNKLNSNKFQFTYGEVMMPKSKFMSKYATDFANPRNLVAGLLNAKDISPILSDCNYIKYGAIPFNENEYKLKNQILDDINEAQEVKVDYRICKISDITEDLMIRLFNEWSVEYEIDGLIIEINDIELCEKFGRETSSNNPVWARAFKSTKFEQVIESEVIGISWNISKQGLIKPTIHIKPTRLDGVMVSNITGNNAKWVKTMGIGVGAKVNVVRSGMVIPKIIGVTKKVAFEMPSIPDIGWNDNGIELITLTETDEQKLKQLISFFNILEVDQVSEGVITQFWDAGYKTVKDILNLTKDDMFKIERFGKRKAEIVFNSIQNSIKDVQLSKLQHATGIFPGLGSRKLVLLEGFTEKPTIQQVMDIEGFAEISAKSYVENWDKFFNFVKDLPITIKKEEKVSTPEDLSNMVVVFTGVRRPDLQEVIESRGGRVASSVSKNTTHLVCKDTNSTSSKTEKARGLNIKIISVEELENLL